MAGNAVVVIPIVSLLRTLERLYLIMDKVVKATKPLATVLSLKMVLIIVLMRLFITTGVVVRQFR